MLNMCPAAVSQFISYPGKLRRAATQQHTSPKVSVRYSNYPEHTCTYTHVHRCCKWDYYDLYFDWTKVDLWAVNQLKCFSINQNPKNEKKNYKTRTCVIVIVSLVGLTDRQTDRESGRQTESDPT